MIGGRGRITRHKPPAHLRLTTERILQAQTILKVRHHVNITEYWNYQYVATVRVASVYVRILICTHWQVIEAIKAEWWNNADHVDSC